MISQMAGGPCQGALCRGRYDGICEGPRPPALAAPTRHRVRGIAAQATFVALLLAAANLRKLANLAEKGEPSRGRARRRSRGHPRLPAR